MSNKTYCPILTIGFGPPEKGQRDLRVCMKDCSWYNLIEEKCNINVIAEYMTDLQADTDGIANAVTDIYESSCLPSEYPWEDSNEHYGYDEGEKDFNFGSGKRT